MTEQAKILIGLIFGLIVLAGCGGGVSENARTASGQPDPAEPAVEDSGTATTDRSDEQSADEESDSSEPGATTTTTAAPVALLSADDAIETYDRYIGQIVDYTRANLLDGNGTFDQARETLAIIDPALLDGALDDVALAFHNCNAEDAIESRAFFEFTALDFDVEHLEQHEINAETWALDLRQFVRIEGFPESITDATVLVTVNGLGPTVVTTADDQSCPLPRSVEAEALLSEARNVLAIAEPATSSGELRSADEVLAEQAASQSIQGTVGEPLQLREGLVVIVSSIAPVRDGGGTPVVQTQLRIENTGADTTTPRFSVVCAGSDETGGELLGDYNSFDALPSGTFEEGQADLLLPGDDVTGEPVPACNTPAVIRVFDNESAATADFPIPDEVIQELG